MPAIIQHQSSTSMHGFSPRRQNFGSIFKRLERHRDDHGRAPRAIGERQTPANSPLRSRDTTKVRLSEQSPAKIVKRSLPVASRPRLTRFVPVVPPLAPVVTAPFDRAITVLDLLHVVKFIVGVMSKHKQYGVMGLWNYGCMYNICLPRIGVIGVAP